MQRALFFFFGLIIAAGIIRLIVTPETAMEIADTYRDFTSMYVVSSAAGLGLVYALAFAFTIPITTILALIIGFVFNFYVALGIIIISTVAGALLIFLPVKYTSLSSSKFFLGDDHEKIIEWAKKRPLAYMLATRFAPLVPFPIAHLVPAEARVKNIDFIWTTLLGTVPASAVFVALGSGSYVVAEGDSLANKPLIVGLGSISIFILVGLYMSRTKEVKNALREIQKMRPSLSAELRESTDE